MAIFAAENTAITKGRTGCTAAATVRVELIHPPGTENSKMYPCFEHQTIPDILPRQFSWRYYATSGGLGPIWTAPNAISHICQATGPGGNCQGSEWLNNVDLKPAHILSDISSCHLRSVSWVTPIGQNSDHGGNITGGPSWVAAIVNAIGTNSACPNGELYWHNTAIFITWDDWGGWYDHERPTILPSPQGDYQYGFRVPLLVVSAYTPAHYIDNVRHDFGSILRFIEHNFGITEGRLTFADQRATSDLRPFFHLSQPARRFLFVAAPLGADFFLNDTRTPTAPDDD
jgi:phospholipase C